MFARHPVHMSRIEFIARRQPNGLVVFEAVPVTLLERLRRAVRRLLRG